MTLDIPALLAKLYVDVVRERGDEILCHCPLHVQNTGKEDSNPSFWINKDTGANLCFSCGWKGSIFSLVGNIREFFDESHNIDYDQVKTWLANTHEISVEQLSSRLKSSKDYVSLPPPIPMSEARLALFIEPPQWALDAREVTAEACRKHQVLWKEKDSQWILPLRDPYTYELLGWQEKSQKPVLERCDEALEFGFSKKFMNRPPGLKKSTTFFGVQHMVKEQVIVVESPLDVVKLDSLNIPGAVAVLGAMVSAPQIKLLRRSEVIISAFDNPAFDPSGKKASEQMLEIARKHGFELKFFNYRDSTAKDIGDMQMQDIQFGIANAKDMIFGEKAYLV